jgi:hypothetical protein
MKLSNNATVAVMKLGSLFGQLACCDDKDLDDILHWSRQAFPEEYAHIPALIEAEQKRRRDG